MSGSSFAPWAFCTESQCQKIAHQVASANGCSGTDAEIKECLQSPSLFDIFSATPFNPVVSDSSESSNAWGTWRFTKDGDLIPKDITLEELFARSSCDFITGVADNEFFNYVKVRQRSRVFEVMASKLRRRRDHRDVARSCHASPALYTKPCFSFAVHWRHVNQDKRDFCHQRMVRTLAIFGHTV